MLHWHSQDLTVKIQALYLESRESVRVRARACTRMYAQPGCCRAAGHRPSPSCSLAAQATHCNHSFCSPGRGAAEANSRNFESCLQVNAAKVRWPCRTASPSQARARRYCRQLGCTPATPCGPRIDTRPIDRHQAGLAPDTGPDCAPDYAQ